MFNVTIVRKRDLIKYLIYITIAIFAIVFLFNMTIQKNENCETKGEATTDKKEIKITNIINKTLPQIFNKNENENQTGNENLESLQNTYMQEIIKQEIGTIRSLEKSRDNLKENENNEQAKENEENNNSTNNTNQNENNNQDNTISNKDLSTQVVTQNPIAENYNTEYSSVKIKNQTDYELTQEMLNPDITVENKNIVIYHTHTCESYTPTENYNYEQTGNFRTVDLNFSVVRVGNELENNFKKFNYNVIHNSTYHDYPAYNGSYTRSLETITNILKENPSDIVIDLHRDAVGSRPDYAPTVKIGDEYAAQIMYVIRNK